MNQSGAWNCHVLRLSICGPVGLLNNCWASHGDYYLKNCRRYFRRRYATILPLIVSVAACTPIPIYQPPSDTSQSAHLKLSLKDQSLLAGVAIISQTEGEIDCGEPLPNVKKMIVIAKGNPLISDLNPSGTYIPAGRKFTFVAMGLNDGFRECGRIVSFVPKTGSNYEITLTNTTIRSPYSAPTVCPIELIEVIPDTNAKGDVLPVETIYEKCHAPK